MKKYLYRCIFVIICLASLALIGCSSQTTVKLDEPYDFTTDGTYLSWKNVNNANHYIVKVNDNEYETETNEFDLRSLSVGYNHVQVRAKEYSTKDYVYQQSDYSEVLYIKKLATPGSISFNYDSISWKTVEGATEYEFTIKNEAQTVVYTTRADSYVSLTAIQDHIIEQGKYYISVTALAENKTSVENDTFLFTTISSTPNSGNVLTVSHQMKAPLDISLNTKTQCIEWEASGYSVGCEATIKDSQKNVVYSGMSKKYYQTYSIPVSDIDTTNLRDGDYTISIKVLKPENPMWILDYHSAIYAIDDSDPVEFNISTSFDEALPTIENIGFYGQTTYITSLTWSSVTTSLYEVCLIDAKSNVLYSETVSTKGIYLVDTYNRFINKIQESGEYAFTVRAICENSNELYIYNNKIVRATKDSEVATFNFIATVNSKVSASDYVTIDHTYGTGFMWHTVNNAIGYLLTVKDASNNVVYTGLGGTSISSHMAVKYFELDEFVQYLKESGEYTFSVQAIGSINIGINGLSKSQDSDIVECAFYYDKEANSISAV